jgi:large subunit ribosomal protein L4
MSKMPELNVRNWKNEEVRPIGVADGAFDAPMREALVHQAVHHHTAALRSGSASTKGRGEVSGSGRKLWRQKKTGRARVGSIRSPLWRKGGTVHGPKPRDYDYHLPRKMRNGALRSVLSQRLREGNLLILDSLELPTHKTRDLLERLRGLGLDQKTALFVDEKDNQNLRLAARNLPNVRALPMSDINVYDILACQYLLLSEAAAVQLGERLS